MSQYLQIEITPQLPPDIFTRNPPASVLVLRVPDGKDVEVAVEPTGRVRITTRKNEVSPGGCFIECGSTLSVSEELSTSMSTSASKSSHTACWWLCGLGELGKFKTLDNARIVNLKFGDQWRRSAHKANTYKQSGCHLSSPQLCAPCLLRPPHASESSFTPPHVAPTSPLISPDSFSSMSVSWAIM